MLCTFYEEPKNQDSAHRLSSLESYALSSLEAPRQGEKLLSHGELLAWWPPEYVTSPFLVGSKHAVSDNPVSGVFQAEGLLFFDMEAKEHRSITRTGCGQKSWGLQMGQDPRRLRVTIGAAQLRLRQ